MSEARVIITATTTLIIIMVSGPGLVPYLVSACLLSPLLFLPGAGASYYPQSGECRGKGKDCTGKKVAAAGLCGVVRNMHCSE